MSLNLTIINSGGAWQCSDHRLVEPRTGRLLDDFSPKHVVLRCPDGAVLLAYAGVGSINRVALSDWIREILRGESRTVDQSLILIREAATRDIGPIISGSFHHMFSVAAFINGSPWVAQIRNFSVTAGGDFTEPASVFSTVALEASDGCAARFGAHHSVLASDQTLLQRVAAKRPHSPADFQNMLAGINKRTAARDGSVSPHCTTTYMPVKGNPFQSKFHDAEQGIVAGPNIPILLFGIDLTDSTKVFSELYKQGVVGTPLAQAEMERVRRSSIMPKNRLRP